MMTKKNGKPKRPDWKLIFKGGKLPRITVAWLRRHGACRESVNLFATTFPDGAEITAANLRIARKAGLYIYWLVHEIAAPSTLGEDVGHAFSCVRDEKKPHGDWGLACEWIRSLGASKNNERFIAAVNAYRKWEARSAKEAK